MTKEKEKNYTFTKSEIEEALRKGFKKKCNILQLEIDEKNNQVLFIVQLLNNTKNSLTLTFSEIENYMRIKNGKIFHIKSIQKVNECELEILLLSIHHSIWESEHRLIISQIIISMEELLTPKSNKESIRFSIRMKKSSKEYKSFTNRLSSQKRKNVEDNLDLLTPLLDLVRIISNQSISDNIIIGLIKSQTEELEKIKQKLKI